MSLPMAMLTPDQVDEMILDDLAEGFDPEDIATSFVDADVAAGEYDGCSSEMELAHTQYMVDVNRVLADVGGC